MRAIKRKVTIVTEVGERKSREWEERDTDLKCHTADLQDGGRSYKPRNAECRWPLEAGKARERVILRANTLILAKGNPFCTSDLHFGF